MQHVIYDSLRRYFTGKMEYHQANIMMYMENPVGIGDHSDIMGAIEQEIAKAAEYREKLDVLGEIELEHYGRQ